MSGLDKSGSFLVQLPEQLHDLVALFRVKVAGRFISQDEFGLKNERPGDAYQLLLPATKLVWEKIFFSNNIKTVQHIGNQGFPLGTFYLFVQQRRFNILVDRKIVKQMIGLENKTDILMKDLGSFFCFS